MNRIANRNGLCLTAGVIFSMLAGCSTPAPQFTDSEWISHSATGRGNYERGDTRRAADAYAKAARRARALDDADALAVTAVNRAVCLLAEDQAAEAQRGVAEALADPRVSPSRRAELGILASRIDLALDQPEQAKQSAMDVLQMDVPPAVKAQALLARSAAELALGETAQAAETLAKGLPAKAWKQLPAVFRADRAVQQADLAAANDSAKEAAAYQTAAADLYRQADRLSEMAEALAAAGRQNRASGQLPAACDQLYRAARSLWAQGAEEEAAAVLAEGIACAEELQDKAVGLRMAELGVTFKSGTRLAE
jgi:hypothetical protein